MGHIAMPLDTTRITDPTAPPRPVGRILVVEDDPAVQKALKRLFETEGFTVEVRSDGRSALESVQSSAPSAIVLDLRLPKLSGRDLCKEVKAQTPTLPIVVLSAASDVSDKVLLLELGADDYVTKPFSPRELLARVRAALRHTVRTAAVSTVTFDGISVDFRKMEVKRDGNLVVLTAQEFKTFQFLVQNAERVISRDELLNEVWGYQNYPSTRTVDNHILKLRQKLDARYTEWDTSSFVDSLETLPETRSQRQPDPVHQCAAAQTAPAHALPALDASDHRRSHHHQSASGAAEHPA